MKQHRLDRGDQVFADLRVVEIGSFVAAPAAATILGDFGADVIKIETLGTGDPWRVQFARPGLPRTTHNFLWTLTSRNKRSVAIDLKDPRGQAVLSRIIEGADVFVTNMPLQARHRLGVDEQRLFAINERLVYASLTGFGEAGPEMHDKAFDATAWWGRSGLMDQVRPDSDAAPTRGVSAMGDHNAALALFGAISSALFRRERTGKGSYVSTSLLANGAWTNGSLIQAALFGAEFEPKQPRSRAANPLQNQYECKDGRWIIVIINFEQQERNWPRLLAALDLAGLIEDPRFESPRNCQANSEALIRILDRTFLQRTAGEWKDLLQKGGMTAGVVARPTDVVSDPQMRAAGALVPLEDVEGAEWTVSSPFSFGGVEKKPAGRPPILGEHTNDVLREVGFSEHQIADLRTASLVG